MCTCSASGLSRATRLLMRWICCAALLSSCGCRVICTVQRSSRDTVGMLNIVQHGGQAAVAQDVEAATPNSGSAPGRCLRQPAQPSTCGKTTRPECMSVAAV